MTFGMEKWGPFSADANAQGLFQEHWESLALDKDRIALALDNVRYEHMDAAGILHIVTLRDESVLAGYFIAFLLPHVHYVDAGLMAFTDIYYLRPHYRSQFGAALLREAEQTMKQRGVVKAYLSCKVHQDHTALFEKLGWKLTDKSFTKYLKA